MKTSVEVMMHAGDFCIAMNGIRANVTICFGSFQSCHEIFKKKTNNRNTEF